jgi:aspartate-semialdehyde dehydrogenase
VTVLAIINPQSLLGEEIKRELGRRKGLASEVRLLATAPEQIGAVTDFGGVAALVQGCSAEAFDGVDLAILLPSAEDTPRRPSGLSESSTLLVVDSSAHWGEGVPVVAGLDSAHIEERSAKVLISPAPIVILLAHLLQPLRQLGPSSLVAQALLPASSHQQSGLDELFEQTRAILSMRDERPTAVFGKQIAFNLLPVETDGSGYLRQLKCLVGDETAVALQIVQAGVFHSLACSLFIQFESDPGLATLRELWAAHPWIEIVENDDLPGPTDAAAREEILVANLSPSPARPAGYQLWAVMDNLTRGGASNVVEVIESLLAISS